MTIGCCVPQIVEWSEVGGVIGLKAFVMGPTRALGLSTWTDNERHRTARRPRGLTISSTTSPQSEVDTVIYDGEGSHMFVPAYDERGLVPCVVQDAASGTLLMLAWMNDDALRLTRETGEVHFWSRSRKALWRKGETSGNTLALVELRLDCDKDSILAIVRPAGPTCHTGTTSCFNATDNNREDDGVPALEGAQVLSRLYEILESRRDAHTTAERSYTRSLLDAGMPKILAKIAEEHRELAAELPSGDDAKVVHETVDLLFHVMVGLVARRIPIGAVFAEVTRRFGTSGHIEKASRPRKDSQ